MRTGGARSSSRRAGGPGEVCPIKRSARKPDISRSRLSDDRQHTPFVAGTTIEESHPPVARLPPFLPCTGRRVKYFRWGFTAEDARVNLKTLYSKPDNERFTDA